MFKAFKITVGIIAGIALALFLLYELSALLCFIL